MHRSPVRSRSAPPKIVRGFLRCQHRLRSRASAWSRCASGPRVPSTLRAGSRATLRIWLELSRGACLEVLGFGLRGSGAFDCRFADSAAREDRAHGAWGFHCRFADSAAREVSIPGASKTQQSGCPVAARAGNVRGLGHPRLVWNCAFAQPGSGLGRLVPAGAGNVRGLGRPRTENRERETRLELATFSLEG